MTADDYKSPDDAAVEWFVLLNDEEVTSEQRSAFEHWLTSHPAHKNAWAEVEKTWGALDALPAAVGQARPIGGSTENVASMARRYQPAPTQRRRHWRPVMIAAALLLAIGAGWQMLPDGFGADHRTSVGERRVVALDDGSEVELGSASALDVNYGVSERRVTLVTGEAFFTVAKDAARPFVITAKGGEILVRGTAFNVKIARGVAVAVTQNSVEVKAVTRAPVRVTKGQGVQYDSVRMSAVTEVDLDSVQAWRQDQLIFHDARLADVLAELQRYRRGYIQLLGSGLGERRVTAVFDARRPEAALETIARNLDLRIYRATSFLIGIARN